MRVHVADHWSGTKSWGTCALAAGYDLGSARRHVQTVFRRKRLSRTVTMLEASERLETAY